MPEIRSSRSTWLAIAAVAALGGCQYPLGIGRAWIDGDWVYEAESEPDAAFDCRITGLVLSLDQEGSTFAGVAQGGTLECSDPGDVAAGTTSESLDGVPITGGEVDGSRVSFALGAGGIRHEGRVEGRSMTGTVIIPVDLGDGQPTTVDGAFAAAREPREPSEQPPLLDLAARASLGKGSRPGDVRYSR